MIWFSRVLSKILSCNKRWETELIECLSNWASCCILLSYWHFILLVDYNRRFLVNWLQLKWCFINWNQLNRLKWCFINWNQLNRLKWCFISWNQLNFFFSSWSQLLLTDNFSLYKKSGSTNALLLAVSEERVSFGLNIGKALLKKRTVYLFQF